MPEHLTPAHHVVEFSPDVVEFGSRLPVLFRSAQALVAFGGFQDRAGTVLAWAADLGRSRGQL